MTANWLLFDFGAALHQFKAGKKALAATEMAYERTLQCIEEETKIAYFRVLETKKLILVIEDSIKTLQEQIKISSDFFTQGLVSKSDLLFVEVQMGEKKKALLRAKNDYLLACMALNRLIGQDLVEEVSLEDLQQITSIPFSLEPLKKHALKNRSDLKAIKKQIESLESRASSSKAAHAPRFYAFGGYSYLQDSLSNQKNWVSGGLGLQFSLYDGGKISAGSEKIRAQLKEARANLEELQNTILMETSNLYAQLQEQLETIAIDKTSLDLAEENLRAATDRYKQGLASIRDLLASEEQLTLSRTNQMRTIYRYQMAYAKIMSIAGGF